MTHSVRDLSQSFDSNKINKLGRANKGIKLRRLRATKENSVTYLQIALADNKAFWYFPA
ncbi:hypothetical protein KOSB73_260813 [Klebsiella grimontii]|jgi:hypothetical protein|uniref:Uncharacterized protein n=1 Tax=Klebsiella grimontii TaxID=2058152 RepID=A0A285B542_9ENTR|nr:unnamed protein product [Klebsiella oxytoca]GJK43786.1 hypothetical protein TUM17559_19290 [Enterobacter cloacae]GJK90968.1 hypothetical protein TUM17568_21740 [Klebsiella oxytoca]GJL10846.1 hypothetical protein TUM17572_06530 [Klebsiella oxytoca]SNU36089.1 hypothetical protein KOSB73_260813 [Klebsiella grimontii]